MKKLLHLCLAFGALGGANLLDPTLAAAFEWSGQISISTTHTFDTVLPDGRTAHTSLTITCPSCWASVSIKPETGTNIVVTPVTLSSISVTTWF